MPITFPLLPTLGPAIAASALYGILAPILIWRTHTSHSFGSYVMFSIFSLLRVTGFACRAVWSQRLSEGITALVYVANILQYVGFILEIMAVVNLKITWIRAAIREGTEPPKMENMGLAALRMIVVSAQILTVIGAVMFLVGAGGSQLSLVQTGNNLKNAAYYIFFVSTIISMVLMNIYFFYHYPQGKWSAFTLMMALYTLLLFKLCFRIAALNLPSTHVVNSDEVYYYCLDALPEFLICTIACAVNLTIVKNGFEPWKPAKGDQSDVEKELV